MSPPYIYVAERTALSCQRITNLGSTFLEQKTRVWSVKQVISFHREISCGWAAGPQWLENNKLLGVKTQVKA
jgi:hypothetical protein